MLRQILIIFFGLMIGASVSFAARSRQVSDLVQWYEPSIEHPVDSSHARVLIWGHANPGSKIVIEKGAVAIYHGKAARDLPSKDLSAAPAEVVLGPNGQFRFSVTLPYTNVEIPISASDKIENTRHYILLMNVQRNFVQITSGNVSEPPTKWAASVGPGFELLSLSQSNSVFSWQHTSALVGTKLGIDYAFNIKNKLSFGLTSLQGVGSLPSGPSYTYSDFEYWLGYNHVLSWQPFRHARLESDLSYAHTNSPVFGRDASGNSTFEMAALDSFRVGMSSRLISHSRFDSAFGLGLLYGLVSGSGLGSISGAIGGYANYALTFRLSFPFYLFGDLSAQYEAFGFSEYDLPTTATVKSSVIQTVVSADAGIQCRF